MDTGVTTTEQTITCQFNREKQTKRFQSFKPVDNDQSLNGSIYTPLADYRAMGQPAAIQVTVTVPR